MSRRFAIAICALGLSGITLQAQEFRVFDRTVQIHGFFSQGFVYTSDNNWLTMDTSAGSPAMTDMGLNLSMPVNDKLRIGAQVYDRNLGHLGDWHPELDWAFLQYKIKPWLGVRGGKVKTVLGLYNDTQDLDFLRTFALLPQGIYSTDLRDTTLAHSGGDFFGDMRLGRLGTISYTAYAGHRQDSLHSGYAYLVGTQGTHLRSFSALQYGGDLRWATPLKGLLVGASRLDEDITILGTMTAVQPALPVRVISKAQWTNQFYAEYRRGKLLLDGEYRHYLTDDEVNRFYEFENNVRSWYVAGTYQVVKRFQLGAYYSHYSIDAPFTTPPLLPGNGHVYDKVVAGRFDLNRFVNFKVEGHFMDGYGLPDNYPIGFYTGNNPQGLEPNTNALVAKTGFNF